MFHEFGINIELNVMFQALKKRIVTHVKNELKVFRRVLTPEDAESDQGLTEDEEVMSDEEEEEQRKSSSMALLKITMHQLRKMDQELLSDILWSSKRILKTLNTQEGIDGR